jgi:F0F1-type ATP synthase delta subunit
MQLPAILVGRSDALHLRREFEALQEYLHQAALRKEDPANIKLPKTSRLLDEFVALNKLDLMHRADHERALTILSDLTDHAPQLHISFSAEPSSAFLAKLTLWLRQNIDPTVLVNVGIQPSIAAGCVVRTKNRQFDMSLAKSFKKHRDLLAEELRPTKDPKEPVPEPAHG